MAICCLKIGDGQQGRADYYQAGYDGGNIVGRVLNGEDPAHIPICQTEKTQFIINMDVARKHSFSLDERLLRRADRIIDSEKHVSSKAKGR